MWKSITYTKRLKRAGKVFFFARSPEAPSTTIERYPPCKTEFTASGLSRPACQISSQPLEDSSSLLVEMKMKNASRQDVCLELEIETSNHAEEKKGCKMSASNSESWKVCGDHTKA